jgi:hypothetical protein
MLLREVSKMQKNYAAMAQGAMPQEQAELSQQDIAELRELDMTSEDFEAMGMPTGNSPEAIKERIIMFLDRFEILEQLSATEKAQLMQDIDQLVQDLAAGNLEGAAENPVSQLVDQASDSLPTLEEYEEASGEEDAA